MAVTVEVKENETAHIIGPARLTVVIDRPEMISIDAADVEPEGMTLAQSSAKKK